MTIEQLIVFVKYSKFPKQVKEAVIEVLEKQIPKKVEDFMELEEEFSSFYKLDFMCPSCLNATICQPYKPKYCKHCGQKLDWECEK